MKKVQKFIDYASSFGLRIYGTASEISQEALQDIMRAVEGEPYADVLSMMLLRSMQQARYSEHNHGHYGLAADYYTHFTSPIRRYPDLLVHRMIRDYGRSKEIAEHFEQVIPEIATQSSNRERRAIEAEREVEAMKKLSTWKNTWAKSMMQLYLASSNSVSLSNCQIQSKV